MKKRLILPAVVAALSLTGLAPAASAASTPQSGTVATAATAACKSLKSLSTLNIRKSATTSSTILGTWPKGAKGCDISGKIGGTYKNVCGIDKYNGWRKINYRGTVGYVPNVCVVYV
ncbi:hypothetical protein DCW30_17625 [Streptomyces alfalfae]|uniref:SH3 domain-containing protein n=1 Tax=Streptomyces alfalfae TaxID=1642299 RepID=A0A1P8TQS8_9ACTN|nr:hypothetical protein [Streptomyces alfalfae]AYA20451.1 hypothetical protein D3X13_33110 [Streptomyces fradiae]APY89992.1 hypothetical protein A7J05_33800 [Streptomyces alfalfae]QQC87509.1 hypothetical protein I8755_03125 [Streptomyces alfalfae]QUI29937.1 hypothetical protein H9W91_03010 [Streptomyces alfalfae]RXX42816.1 hypothetical protein DCW30_17625 [Streptomyces alfalfae]